MPKPKSTTGFDTCRDQDLVRRKCKHCGDKTVFPPWTAPERVHLELCVACYMNRKRNEARRAGRRP